MKTFILEWNPAIGGYRTEDFENDLHYMDNGEFSWSVWDWRNARSGDNFYMVLCGEGRTGIVMKGFFTSEPYLAEDWSGQRRDVHYMEMRPTFMVNPLVSRRFISTEMLEQQIPGFGWNGGHSGREISGAQLRRLDAMWAEFESSFPTEDLDCTTACARDIPEAGLDDAVLLAAKAHYDCRDGEGRPTILRTLEKTMKAGSDRERVVTLLEEVSTVSDYEMGYLRDVGFPEDVIDALQERKESLQRNCC